jgi:hypothetical protein
MTQNKKINPDKLQELSNLEKEQSISENQTNHNDFEVAKTAEQTQNNSNLLDGYYVLDNHALPYEGALYPSSWKFAYRCPTSKEVANFSTLNDQDQPSIIIAIEDLIRKCVVIYDVEKDQQISSSEINDSDRIFFILLLHDLYLPSKPIQYPTICMMCKEPVDAILTSKTLQFPTLTEKLLSIFDGRKFTFDMSVMGVEDPIIFLIPTVERASRIFKYVIKVYRDEQNDKERKEDKFVYDKQFLLFVPFLYERGNETLKELYSKFQKIQSDENRFKAYLEIISKLKLDNFENIVVECPSCQAIEEAPLRFPGGWKNMFVGGASASGYFN